MLECSVAVLLRTIKALREGHSRNKGLSWPCEGWGGPIIFENALHTPPHPLWLYPTHNTFATLVGGGCERMIFVAIK
jgi:hypothetical protein